MPLSLHSSRRLLVWCAVPLLLLTLVMLALSVRAAVSGKNGGYLLKQDTGTVPWKVLTAEQVEDGTIIPGDTHVVFHLPANFDRMYREVLLGYKGKKTRYWGYCFPQNEEPDTVAKRQGFPGLVFLSEKERAIRKAEDARRAQTYTPLEPPTTEEEVESLTRRSPGAVRHQLEFFDPETICYIMTDETLSIGLDPDGDRLNTQLEREVGTDPSVQDTDGDGVRDDTEYFTGTQPTVRDTDGDGIIDGIEDKNWNGRIELDETDPRSIDSDRDGLCDGFCKVKFRRQWTLLGEDKNLNGSVDQGETNPLARDSNRDGEPDDIEFYECLAAGEDSYSCP